MIEVNYRQIPDFENTVLPNIYKLYRLGLVTRDKVEASIAAGCLMGLIFSMWIIYVISAFNLHFLLTPVSISVIFLLSFSLNLVLVLGGKRYNRIITKLELNNPPIYYHIIVYLLYAWTFLGLIFL